MQINTSRSSELEITREMDLVQFVFLQLLTKPLVYILPIIFFDKASKLNQKHLALGGPLWYLWHYYCISTRINFLLGVHSAEFRMDRPNFTPIVDEFANSSIRVFKTNLSRELSQN